MFKKIAAAALLLIVAACAARHPRPAAPPPGPAEKLQALPAAGEYAIDSGTSELRLLVYRAGPLRNLGHNHVMVNRAVSGSVQIGAGLSASSFSLHTRADAFVVDDAGSRQEEGGDFSGEISEDARAGTRRNMLGGAVLNAAEFPDIAVRSTSLAGSLAAASADVEISAAGHTSRISVPLSLQGDAHYMIASGSLELRQSALDIVPYSLMHGALQVQDAMQLKFKIMVPTK